jgi:hypothetical protein
MRAAVSIADPGVEPGQSAFWIDSTNVLRMDHEERANLNRENQFRSEIDSCPRPLQCYLSIQLRQIVQLNSMPTRVQV